MVVENFLEIFVQAKHFGIMSVTVNLEDMVNNTHPCNINFKQNLHRQITWTQIWKLKVKKLVLPNLHLLEDKIKYFVLFFVVKFAKIIMKTISIFYLTTILIYVSTIFPRRKVETTQFFINFPRHCALGHILFDFWIPIRSMMWVPGRKLYNQPRNQGVYTQANWNQYKQQKKQ